MQFSQEHPIWTIIVNAYTNNQQPIIFALANIFFIVAIGIAIYGFVKWKSDNSSKHFTTIVASVISAIFLIFAIIYLFNPNNQTGTYQGSVDIAFTSSVDNSDNKIAIFSDKDSDDSEIDSFIMKASDMKELGIKAGKTVQVKADNKPTPDKEDNIIKLDKSDVKDVKEASNISSYNEQQSKAEEAKKKEEEKKKQEAKDKKDKKDKKKNKKD
ncbi:hypothetical protein BUY35_00535 [Staphylococcus cohnii]|nr:hypothetical protein BUY35_00535 [Staphylococcus cohnii]